MSTNNNRNSFDRFDDNLCKIILNYLSLEDRIRSECVSHQWKRTVYQNVDKLELISMNDLTKKLISSKTRKPLNCEALETVLKKCPNIRHIEMSMDYSLTPVLGTDYRTDHHMDEVYELIMKYCPHLTSFKSSYLWLSREMCDKFNQLFGPQLESFGHSIQTFEFLRNDFKLFKNVKRLKLFIPSDIKSDNYFDNPFKGLTHLYIKYEENGHQIVTTIIRENPGLRYLELCEYGNRGSKTDQLVSDLTKLSQLISFKISWYSNNSSDQIWLTFKELGQSCVLLRRMKLANFGQELNFPHKILQMMKYFAGLTHLKLIDNTWGGDVTVLEGRPIICGNTSCELLKDCPNLTHLSLRLNRLKNYFFTDIGKHLPKLVSLKITNSDATDSIADTIAGLSELTVLCFKQKKKVFDINDSYRSLSYKSGEKLFKSCPKLKLIEVIYPKDEYTYFKFGKSFWWRHEHAKKRR